MMQTDVEVIRQEMQELATLKTAMEQKRDELIRMTKSAGAFQNQGEESVNNATNIILGLLTASKYTPGEDTSLVNQSLEGV